ncbi:hypothetical protein ACO0QE_000159 [Hanseniaspora vineae]
MSDSGVPEERVRKHIDESEDDEDRGDDGEGQGYAGGGDHTEPDYQAEGVVMDEHARKRHDLEVRMTQALKRQGRGSSRRSRRDEEDLEQMLDDKILRLKDEMSLAAQRDMETIERRINDDEEEEEDEEEDHEEEADEDGQKKSDGKSTHKHNKKKEYQPAMEKVKLLPKVAAALNKVSLADTILDNNLLQAVKFWLEPLPDGSLPSFEIQKTLIHAIAQLPIKTEHLKESGLGKVMIFYTKSSRVEPSLKRLSDKIVAEWTRPIIGASDNYRDKSIMKIDFDVQKYKEKSTQELKKNLAKEKSARLAIANGGADISGSVTKSSKKSKRGSTKDGKKRSSLYDPGQQRKNRTVIPQQTTTDYKYAPVSNIENLKDHQLSFKTSGVGSSLSNSELYKRINSRLGNTKKRR